MARCEKLEFKGIHYLFYYPKNYVEGKKYPVMFHLHGAGSRGTNFDNFKGSVILNALDREDSALSNGFCVFPQCHKEAYQDQLKKFTTEKMLISQTSMLLVYLWADMAFIK